MAIIFWVLLNLNAIEPESRTQVSRMNYTSMAFRNFLAALFKAAGSCSNSTLAQKSFAKCQNSSSEVQLTTQQQSPQMPEGTADKAKSRQPYVQASIFHLCLGAGRDRWHTLQHEGVDRRQKESLAPPRVLGAVPPSKNFRSTTNKFPLSSSCVTLLHFLGPGFCSLSCSTLACLLALAKVDLPVLPHLFLIMHAPPWQNLITADLAGFHAQLVISRIDFLGWGEIWKRCSLWAGRDRGAGRGRSEACLGAEPAKRFPRLRITWTWQDQSLGLSKSLSITARASLNT